MHISYLLSFEELAVLAHFSGCETLVGMNELPDVNEEDCDRILEKLGEKGMINMQEKSASVDAALGFALHTMSKPALAIRSVSGAIGFAASKIGVCVCRDKRAKKRCIITPLPTAGEAADMLWENANCGFEQASFALYKNGGWERKELTKPALVEILNEVMN